MTQLTKQQINRQDFVDNQIFELINSLVPPSKRIEWDIELIGNIRESFYKEIKKKIKNTKEKQFYPFINIEK